MIESESNIEIPSPFKDRIDGPVWQTPVYLLLGRRQVVKAPGFDPGIRRFESSRPSHFFDREMPVILKNVPLSDRLYQLACICLAG